MGSDEDPKHKWQGVMKPKHEVAITKGFYLGKYEVTQAQYETLTGRNPSKWKGPSHPVEHVTWTQATAFCRLATERTRRHFRLPSEAEWEYACRAGSTDEFCFGSDGSKIGDYAWYYRNSARQTRAVGQKRPNAWGLHDMHGNVWEWVADRYAADYYASSPRVDPAGPAGRDYRLVRGGCFSDHPSACRSALRYPRRPADDDCNRGFRVAVSLTSAAVPMTSKDTVTGSGRGEGKGSQGPDKAFDGNTRSKYCTKHRTMWLQYRFGSGRKKIETYHITSANDVPTRDPRDWTLQGSNDGHKWDVLDRRSDERFSQRFQRREFKVTEPGEYSHYRLDVTRNCGDVCSQIAELELLTEEEQKKAKAHSLEPGPLTLGLGGGVTMEFVYIKPGVFMMGGDEAPTESWQGVEKPKHEVAITRGFYIGRCEVTRGQFAEFVEATGYRTEAERGGESEGRRADGTWGEIAGANWRDPVVFAQDDSHPVMCVSWNDVKAFCDWAAARTRRDVRLPTEAEWEYAVRAGSTARHCFGDHGGGIGEYAWCHGNSGMQTHPVGQKRANTWGLHDVHGNVWEWVADWYDAGYYAKSPRENPAGPDSGSDRLLRGGGWQDDSSGCRSAIRNPKSPSDRSTYGGFRVAVSLTRAEAAASSRAPAAARPPGVPTDAARFGGHRYKLFTQKMNWHDAKAFCERAGGHLVTITSKEEQDFVGGLARGAGEFAWIGLSDVREQGKWEWVTGEPMAYVAWAPREPSTKNERCGNLCAHKGYLWNDGFHRESYPFLCEWEVPPAVARPPNVPPDAVESGGHWYKPFTKGMTWHEAKAFCEREGGHLVTITSKEENDFVTKLARSAGLSPWLGLTDERREGNWEWVTGEPFGFTSWCIGEPSGSHEGEPESWGAMDSGKAYLWNDARRGQLLPFICEWEPAPRHAGVRADRPWRPVFGGRTTDCVHKNSRRQWRVADGALETVASNGQGFTQRSFADGEIRIRFEARGLNFVSFGVRVDWSSKETAYPASVAYREAQAGSMEGKIHEQLFVCRGSRITASLDGRPVPVHFPAKLSANGRIMLWGGGKKKESRLRIVSIEFRDLPPGAPPALAGVDLARGLIGHWTFDEGTGTTARDSSPRGSHLKLSGGARWTDGKLGRGLRLGQGGMGNRVPSVTVSGASISVWVRHDRFRSGNIERYVTLQSDRVCLRKVGNGDLEFYVKPLRGVRCRFPIPEKEWMHVVGTWDGTMMHIYVNGRAMAGRKVPGDPVSIDGVSVEHSEWLNGSLDDVRVYGRALTGGEVMALASMGGAPASRQVFDVVEFGGHRYKLFTQQMTWPDAKAFCERQGGHLVTITSKEESDFVVDLTRRVNGRYWIGFTDGRVEGTWEWVTGEPVKFTAWAEGQPNSMDGDQDYGIINGSEYDSLWDDNGDHNVRARGGNGFVCEWEPAPAPGNVASDITGSCLVNADMSSGGAVPTGWKMAKDAAPNARLVRDTTVFSKGPASLKLDCPRRADKATVMQHFKLVPRGRFSVSGHVRAAGGPDLFQVALWASDAEWKELAWILLGTASGGRDWTALSKDVELPPGVVNVDLLVTCKGPGAVWLDEVRVGPPRVAWDRSSRQPYRTAALGGRRYGVYPTWTTWREAKAFCERVGGHLVTITSVEENAVVAGLAAAAGAEVWIGFSDERQEGTWEWITGEGAAYTNWRGGEPNNAQGAEDCATLGQMPGGQWRDAKADAWGAGGFVCEWEAGAKAMKTPAGVGADLTRGLVGHWKFDDGEGTVARDSSGKRCDGQIKGGAKWAEGRTGGALEFDGRDDYVLIAGQDLATSGDYSLAAWSKLTSWNGWRVLVAKGYAGMTHHPDSKVFGAWHAHVDDPEHVKYFRGQRVENPGRWHHVAMTVDTGAAEVRLYVDGTMHQIASYGKPGDGGFSWASPWTIGA
ncbi:MAG: SUMF1/EgtB/PvdO family nonheme iron enzyme [Planctomycetota bacterium]|jgi:formylglycine-generating enzyme required for sulfatase activity